MKNIKFMTYTREDIVREMITRGREFLDEWFAFWFGENEEVKKGD